MKKTKKHNKFYEYFLITIGVGLISVAIHTFFAPYTMVTGGFTGISIIIQSLSSQMGMAIPIWMTTITLNIPLIIIALRVRGLAFVIKTIYAILALTIALFFAEFIPELIPELKNMDLTLAAVFGGVLQGTGVGLVFRCMASTGGTELIANIINKFRPHISLQRLLFNIDFCIIMAGFFIFGPERAMYAIIAMYIITKMIERILEGINFAKAAFIISHKPEDVANSIMLRLNRGVTGLYGRGMYTGGEKNVMLCAVSTKEIITLKNIVYETDPLAFVMVADVREVLGEGFTWNQEGSS